MTGTTWTWAELDDQGVELVQETERTLGADVVLVFAEGQPRAHGGIFGLVPADLDASQLECLRGVEQRVGAVAVAYSRA
jgi:hypothetical protein